MKKKHMETFLYSAKCTQFYNFLPLTTPTFSPSGGTRNRFMAFWRSPPSNRVVNTDYEGKQIQRNHLTLSMLNCFKK